MGLAPSRVVIDADKGFEDTDIFEYKAFGERFANIVESGDSELVIALDGRWGSGKTTFTQQWAGLLRQRGHAVVQFDAFAHDYQDDALIALAGELYARSEGKTEGGLNKLRTSFLKSAAGLTKALPSLSTRLAVNFVAQGALPPAVVSKLTEALEKKKESYVEERIKQAKTAKEAVGEFRKHLSILATELAESKGPCIFIVDELDRCKPTFALNLLERIKHLFSVKGLCFVLVAHLPQLARMVEKEYGGDTGREYLEKFYDLRITLPVPNLERRNKQYLEHIWRSMSLAVDEQELLRHVTEGLCALAGAYELPLRTLEQIARNVELVFLATHRRYFRLGPLIAGLSVMRVVKPAIYEKARTGMLTMPVAMDFINIGGWRLESTWDIEDHESTWIYATLSDEELRDPKWKQLTEEHGQRQRNFLRLKRSDMIRITCQYIDDLWQREP